jgi:SAM-dependent methyltransferase
VAIHPRLATAVQPDPNSLDYAFHRFIGMNSAGQRAVHQFYLPFYAPAQGHTSSGHVAAGHAVAGQTTKVVDLACGDGDFVALLLEAGVDALGVDADPKTCADAQAKGLPVRCQNVFDYLAATPANSVDGIFSAHLVEHLAYPQVVELVAEAARILRPGGRLLLATPDCRSLFSHLEMYYLHFGHVSFYHPRLLTFFMEQEGFTDLTYDANPNIGSPLLPQIQAIAARTPPSKSSGASEPRETSVPYTRTVPLQGASPLHKLSYAIKRRLAQWLVLPFTDSLAASTQARLTALESDVVRLADDLQSLNGSFECFATGIKGGIKAASDGSVPRTQL